MCGHLIVILKHKLFLDINSGKCGTGHLGNRLTSSSVSPTCVVARFHLEIFVFFQFHICHVLET